MLFRKTTFSATLGIALACTLFATPLAFAQNGRDVQIKSAGAHTGASASGHAPIGVMGDHMHSKGEWMLSYRFMHMAMQGNRNGNNRISPESIVTTVPNPFTGPATLRVVPTEMTMDMHMLGVMHAPAEWLTLMGMASYIEKEMDHITFDPGPGTTRIGTFTTKSSGWGDASVTGLVRLHEGAGHSLHLNAGISLPTGAIDEEDDILTPMGMRRTQRMPYAMQLGTGTYDFHPGITYTGHDRAWSWGAQYTAEIRLEDENDEGYAWGNRHVMTAWGAYEWAQWLSTSARLTATRQGDITGQDPHIAAPVQTADPDNYGGRQVDFSLGANLIGIQGPLRDHRFAAEIRLPLYRDLNGPQLETDWTLTVGWQYAF